MALLPMVTICSYPDRNGVITLSGLVDEDKPHGTKPTHIRVQSGESLSTTAQEFKELYDRRPRWLMHWGVKKTQQRSIAAYLPADLGCEFYRDRPLPALVHHPMPIMPPYSAHYPYKASMGTYANGFRDDTPADILAVVGAQSLGLAIKPATAFHLWYLGIEEAMRGVEMNRVAREGLPSAYDHLLGLE